MVKILLATLYDYKAVMSSIARLSPDRLILLIDKEPNDKQKESLELIEKSLAHAIEISTISTEVYDIVEVAKEAVKVIDLLSMKDSIYIDVTSGRKTKALGLLFGAYARIDRISKISYVTEEKNEVIYLPKLTYSLTKGQKKVIEHISNNPGCSLVDINIDVSRGMLYKHIKELREMGIIDDMKLTDYGRIAIL